jgi:ABC-type multidrug transport system ATPase subunit
MGHQPDKAIHYMEEAQALADHVCVMSKGEITATGTQEA